MFSFHYLQDAPIIATGCYPELGGNINGPALIRAPDWVESPPGRYLLYFAHHMGRSIRLACSDHLCGPWRLCEPAPLLLENSCFPTELERHETAPGEQVAIDYPHIASPEIWIDHQQRRIRLYYHGLMADGSQQTRLAISRDGQHFTAREQPIGEPYLKIFRHGDWFYGLSMPARLSRSRNGLDNFEAGPQLTEEPIRHHDVLSFEQCWYLFWTRVGDRPERILVTRLDTNGDWRDWRLGETADLHRAQRAWEGSGLPPKASEYGAIMMPANQLRDPAIYQEERRIYLLYSVAGEQGIAMGEIRPDPAACD